MTLLTVIRHAKSSWDDSMVEDFDRPLNKRGRSAAERIGRELKNRRFRFDLVLASPAKRVRETLEGIEEGYGEPLTVQFEPAIYNASKRSLFELVRRIPESVHAPMLVGHNQGLERLILALATDDPCGLRDRVEAKFPTAAVALIQLSEGRWAEVREGSGEIRELILPRELD